MIARLILRWAKNRKPDFVIGGLDNPYLERHWLLPRNPLFNVYVHRFLRSDDDRAEHTHPWINMSWLLQGCYIEWQHGKPFYRNAGDIVFRHSGHIQHRIELNDGPAWTVFFTGPRYKTWHFACPQGLIPWKDFVASDDKGAVGRGCEQ